MVESVTIRRATESDAPELLAIYRPFVEATAISFETIAPTSEEFAARIARAIANWQWLVAEREGQCVGYAYGSSHRKRAAYRWSVEVSAYIHPNFYRQGIGRALYRVLVDELADKGFCNAFAGVTLPNESSVAFHQAEGFEPIGVFKAVGWKFGKWHDVAWFQRRLRSMPLTE